MAVTAQPLDPLFENGPIAHSRHNFQTKDRPSLGVDFIPMSVNEVSTLKSYAHLDDQLYSQVHT